MIDITELRDRIKTAKTSGDAKELLRLFREGVALTERSASFIDWYAMRVNLALYLQKDGDESAIEEAISVYRSILTRVRAEDISDKLPLISMFLAGLYAERRTGSRIENLNQAIAYYEVAVKLMNPRQESLLWASVVTQLGEAYVDLGKVSGAPLGEVDSAKRLLRTAVRIFRRKECAEECGEASRALRRLFMTELEFRIRSVETGTHKGDSHHI
jgi:tetratricopeptide (TPR) repeat protein